MTATPHRLIAARPAPPLERCPAGGAARPRTELVHKGVRLNCCAGCYGERRHAARVRGAQANRARRLRQKRAGGRPCPAYVAWTVEAWPHGAVVVYGPRGRAWPEATVLPAYGTCSCGEPGCVHLVVALLAQQGARR